MENHNPVLKLMIASLLSIAILSCTSNDEVMIEVSYDATLGTEGFDGRLLVMTPFLNLGFKSMIQTKLA